MTDAFADSIDRRNPDRMANDDPALRSLGGAWHAFLGFPTPRILAAQLAVLLPVRLWLAAWSWTDLALTLAVVAYWPLQEWLLHRFLLHARPLHLGAFTLDNSAAKVHRAHHQEPSMLSRIFLPWRLLLLLVALNVSSWHALLPHPQAVTLGAALGAAALLYEWTHFLTHTPYPPRGGYYRRIRRLHNLHHFKNEHFWFGFTFPWIDTLLGTAPDPGQVAKSETVRTLGIAD